MELTLIVAGLLAALIRSQIAPGWLFSVSAVLGLSVIALAATATRPPDIGCRPGVLRGMRGTVLEFAQVVKRFGALVALDGCSFEVRPGRLTGFLGPNGAGKTTATRAVVALTELDAGNVRWRVGAGRAQARRPRAGTGVP